jgi:ketosteroid isomerase-like protein
MSSHTIRTGITGTAIGGADENDRLADAALLGALRRTEAAVAAMRSGDPEPYIACWAESEDATLFGAWGPIERGSPALFDTFRWVASRYVGDRSPVTATVENTVIASSGDLAYTVGFERGAVRVDRGREEEMVIRVTHIYRRGNDGWRLIHRHADFPPADQRRR